MTPTALRFVRVVLLLGICFSLIGMYAAKVGTRIEPFRALRAHVERPSETTQRALDEAFARDRRYRLVGVSAFGVLLLVSVGGLIAIERRLHSRTI